MRMKSASWTTSSFAQNFHAMKAIAHSWRAFLLLTDNIIDRCYDKAVAPRSPMSEEQPKKQEIKEELLKNELTEDELKDVSGGRGVTEQSVNNWIDERIHFLDPSA